MKWLITNLACLLFNNLCYSYTRFLCALKFFWAADSQSQILYPHCCWQKVTLILPLSYLLTSFLSHSICLHLSSSVCLFFFTGELILPELISHEPSLIVWLQSPHAAAMVTGRAYSCSERKFNTTFDDISRMRCTRICPCMCGCLLVQVRLIYLTDLYPSQKATGVRKSCNSVLCISHFLITSENEKYQQIVWSYMSICKHSLLRGMRFVRELGFLWVLSVSTSL